MHVHVLFKNKTTIPNYLCLLHIQQYHYQRKPTTCNYILLLKDICYLCYTNSQPKKRLVSKAVSLPQFPPPSVLATAVTPSSRDVQPEADVDILKYQRIRLEINLFLQ